MVVAHSQGTLISAVMVRLLRLIYDPARRQLSKTERASELAALARTGVTLDPRRFEDVTRAELKRLEIYCFANCASQMRYVDPANALPWIESLGNEHDLVARLGMLAPDAAAEEIVIDGPMWMHPGAWGHLLNAHYLHAIERAHSSAQTPGGSADPYVQFGGPTASAPRLFRYIDGGR